MSQYLPFGKKIIPTQEQVEKQQYKFKQYDYYGIPYGNFDMSDDGEGYKSQKDIDREKARLLIIKREQIPKELGSKLLEYKQQELSEKK